MLSIEIGPDLVEVAPKPTQPPLDGRLRRMDRKNVLTLSFFIAVVVLVMPNNYALGGDPCGDPFVEGIVESIA